MSAKNDERDNHPSEPKNAATLKHVQNFNIVHIVAPRSTLSLSLPTVVQYTTFHHSCIGSWSYAFWSLLTAPSRCYTPAAVPSQHVKCLCTFISCVKDSSFLINTSLSTSQKFYNNSSEPIKVMCILVQAHRLYSPLGGQRYSSTLS